MRLKIKKKTSGESEKDNKTYSKKGDSDKYKNNNNQTPGQVSVKSTQEKASGARDSAGVFQGGGIKDRKSDKPIKPATKKMIRVSKRMNKARKVKIKSTRKKSY